MAPAVDAGVRFYCSIYNKSSWEVGLSVLALKTSRVVFCSDTNTDICWQLKFQWKVNKFGHQI